MHRLCMCIHTDGDPIETSSLTFMGISGDGPRKTYDTDSHPYRSDAGPYTMFALLMSDQCPRSIRILYDRFGEVFRGSGPFPNQLEAAIRAIDAINPLRTVKGFGGAVRRFPRTSIIEALCNAVCHFDPWMEKDIWVVITRERLCVCSPGGYDLLVREGSGITARNTHLAGVLVDRGHARMQYRGMALMRVPYRNTWQRPVIKEVNGWVAVILPPVCISWHEQDEALLSLEGFLRRNPGSSLEDVCKGMFLSPNAAKAMLQTLETDNSIFAMGLRQDARYYLLSQSRCRRFGRCTSRPRPSRP